MTVEDAIILATAAHAGQKDKSGEPYIFHPLRVMISLDDPKERVIAVLHDVLEDTNVTIGDLLKAGCDTETIKILLLLRHEKNEPYEDYLNRIITDDTARNVKLADVKDNLDLDRLEKLDEETQMRLKRKYVEAMWKLTKLVIEK